MVSHRLRRFLEPQVRGPWELFDELQRDVSSLFNAGMGGDRVRIWSSDDSAVIEVDAPGIDPDACDISIKDALVSVTTAAAPDSPEAATRVHLRERSRSDLRQQVQLPFPLDASRTEAVYDRGILRISLHRREDSKPARIAVKAN
ncbi:MAG: Hsp20/alpha crystallin family protein [Planctomyces sp.]|nr:Hsp20/alpha crystallin family protein [Planctomyces sp.]